MIKRIAFTFLVFAAVAGSAAAQEKSPSNYAPGREALAQETFQKLVDIASTLDLLNLAVDLSKGSNLAEDHPDLWTAVLENILFDYCNVSDDLLTVENYRVKNYFGIKHHTLRSFPEWDELGQNYTAQRIVLENADEKAPRLYLVSDPLPLGSPRLRAKKIEALQNETVLIPRKPRPVPQLPTSKKARKKAARSAKR